MGSIIALFIQLIIQNPERETTFWINKISIEQQIPKKEVLKQVIYFYGNKVLLDEEIQKANRNIKINTQRIINELFLLSINEGGEYNIIVRLNNEWNNLLIYLRSINYNDYYELVWMLSDNITLNNNAKLERYSLEDSLHIISSYWDEEYSVVNKQWLEGIKKILIDGSRNPKLSFASKKLLEEKKIKVAEVQKSPIYNSVLNTHFYLDPPWKKYDIPFGSIGWRMGYGEDYLDSWYSFFDKLPTEFKNIYHKTITAPSAWKEWYENQFR